MQPAIEIHDLRKTYGATVAVEGLTLTAGRGEVLALLGPNGAGKTTTVECVEGYRTPDRGTVRVLGLDPVRDHARLAPLLGVMLQEGGAWQAATPRHMVRLYARFHRHPDDADHLLERVGLAGAPATTRYRALSGGQQQRLRLALALVGRPRVVVLDEPSAGLDPRGRQLIADLVAGLRAGGATVLLTTHLIDEAERLADRVAVIDRGRLLACDTPAALLARASRRVVVRSAAAGDPGRLAADRLAADLATAVGAPVEPAGPGRWVVAAGQEAVPAIAAWFAQAGLPLTEVSAAPGGLEEVYLRLTDPARAADGAPAPGLASSVAGAGADGPAAASTRAPGTAPPPVGRDPETGPATAAPAARRIQAQAGMELRLLARNGENLLVTLGIPAGLLAFFTLVDVLPTGGEPAVRFLLPRMLTVALMGSALVALAIHTGFERGYLVLKRLGASPLRRRDLIAAKALAVAATVAVQALALVALALLLGWPGGADPAGASAPEPGAAVAWSALALALGLALGTSAFAGLGLLLAGTLRPTVTLAAANGLFVVLLLTSGLLFPLERLGDPLAGAAALLPSTALARLLDAALHAGALPPGPLAVLLGWALLAPALAAWRFRWE